MLKRLLLAALVVASCNAETSTVQFEPQVRRLDPTYIFGAISGAVNAVAARKQEKHPDRIHPLSILAALFNQAAQVVHDEIAEEEAQKRTIDFVQKPCSEMDIQSLIDTLTEQAASDETFKHIVSGTRYFNVYLLTEQDQRAAYLSKILSTDANKKAFVGELLGSAGNYVADKVYRTANDLAVTMLDAISRADFAAKRTVPQTIENTQCSEATLLEAIKKLVASGQRNLEGDDLSWSVIDSLVTVGLTLRAILLSDVNLFSFWKETAFVGALIATDDVDLIREQITSFVSDDEQRIAFVQELVYCIYHVVFNRLGQMLALAYQTVQLTAATEQMAENVSAQAIALEELDEELAAMQDALALEDLEEAIAEMELVCDDVDSDYSDDFDDSNWSDDSADSDWDDDFDDSYDDSSDVNSDEDSWVDTVTADFDAAQGPAPADDSANTTDAAVIDTTSSDAVPADTSSSDATTTDTSADASAADASAVTPDTTTSEAPEADAA